MGSKAHFFWLKLAVLHIKLNKIEYLANTKSSIHASSAPGVGSKCHFLCKRHVAYQIKGNVAISTTYSHTDTTLGVGSKGQSIFFLKEVMLHTILKRMERRAQCKQLRLCRVCADAYVHQCLCGSTVQ